MDCMAITGGSSVAEMSPTQPAAGRAPPGDLIPTIAVGGGDPDSRNPDEEGVTHR